MLMFDPVTTNTCAGGRAAWTGVATPKQTKPIASRAFTNLLIGFESTLEQLLPNVFHFHELALH